MDEYARMRQIHEKLDAEIVVPATAQAAVAFATSRGALYSFFIQTVDVNVSTHVDGKDFTIQDSNGTPKIAISFLDDAEGDATSESDWRHFDFGPKGWQATQGKNLDWVANNGGSGMVAKVVVRGYQRLTGVGAA